MLEKIVTFALQQRVFIVVVAVIVAVAGWFAWTRLPIEAFPDVQDVQVIVVTQYPGQAPEEVERSISMPIEREMTGVARLAQIRSVSMFGLSVVTVTFADKTDDYFARQQVIEKLQGVSLPPGVTPTLAPLTNAVGEVYRYIVQAPPGMPAAEVRALQDWVIRPALRRVAGVVEVVSFGGEVKEYQVRIDPQRLRKNGVTLQQVSDAIAANSGNAGGGIMRRGDEALVVRSIGLFRSVDDISRVVVVSRNGVPVLVGDVATVAVGSRPLSGVVSFGDQDSVVQGIVQMTKGQNASQVVANLKAGMEELKSKLPPGVALVPYYDRTQLVDHTVHTVTENLALGAGLVVAILLFFLRNWRAAAIVAGVIPLSLFVAFILMDARGVSANLISLGSVDFGIIIDSAVVLVEALMVKLALSQRESAQPSTYAGRMHTLRNTAVSMGSPILFSKAIIILAFLPIFTFQRVEGKIFSPMAYTLSFALVGAIVLTLTLVPALLSFAVRSSDMAERHSAWMDGAREWYRRKLVTVWRRRNVVILGSLAILAAAVGGATQLGSEFLPKLDEGNLWLTITLPPATSMEKTGEVEKVVRGILRSYPEVRSVVSQVGRPDDGTDPKGPNNMEIMAEFAPRDTWRFPDKDSMIADMTRKIRAMPGVPTNFSQVIEDSVEEAMSGVKGEIAVKIYGPDLEILEDKGEQVARVLSGIRGSADVAAIKVGGASELTLTIDREKLSRYGLNVQDVNDAVATAFGGRAVAAFFEPGRVFDVTVRLAAPFRQAADDAAEIPLALPGGGGATIPLGEVAKIETRQGAARISREAGGRTVAVKANLLGRDQGSFVAEARAKVAAQVRLPPGYTLTWGGQFENQQRALARLKVIVPLSVLGIFVLLFWAFRSIPTALVVLAMVPFTLVGGILGLALAGLHLSISAAVGFIAVAGISVQNGVIMVERFLEALREGASLEQAVVDGAVERLRPIVMTALMAGLGLLPAALSHGIGSETQRPFAVVIVGGIVSATVFTLLLLPLLYSLAAEKLTNRSV